MTRREAVPGAAPGAAVPVSWENPMVSSTRRLIGLGLVVVAAVAAVWSAFLDWYANRNGSDIRLQDLFGSITQQTADSLGSLMIPMAVSAVLVLAGIVVWWRWLWALGGVIVLTTVVLWIVRQAQTPSGLHAALVGAGPWLAASAGALMLLASVVATARREHRPRGQDEQLSPDWTPTAGTQVGQTEGTGQPRTRG